MNNPNKIKECLLDIKFKGKRVCLVTNYRTGSTFFIRETFKVNKIPPTPNWEHFNSTKSFNESFNLLRKGPSFIFKLMPDQIDHSVSGIKQIANRCDEMVYLYRRDFVAQASSWVAWNLTGDHEHHWGEDRMYEVEPTQEIADKYTNQLLENYQSMKYIYNQYPGKVFCLEDFPNQYPYNRNYKWMSKVSIPKYNVQKEVFNIQ
jgi:hypothetical protein